MRSHVKVYVLLVCIQLLCFGLIVVSFITQRKIGFSFGLFMLAEAIGLTLRTLYVISKYSVHLWDLRQTELWESKGTITYYIDFSFEMCVVSIDFLHYFHMLIYGNFYLSMASLVICMELKRLFVDLRRRMRRHSNYLRVIEKMEKRFPWANQAELSYSEKCAVCWEKLDKARRLPCAHVFHHNCLRSWLEQDTSCPTCRKSLQDEKPPVPPAQQQTQQDGAVPAPAPEAGGEQQVQQVAPPQPLQRNYFHFEGSRYISWLPSFSVQVTHNLGGAQAANGAQAAGGSGGGAGGMASAFLRRANLLLGGGGPGLRRLGLDPARLNAMTDQVRQLFPNIPLEVIQHDLNRTHSVEITIENILEERIDLFNVNATAAAGQPAAAQAHHHHHHHHHQQQHRHHLLHDDDDEDEDDDDDLMHGDVDDDEDDEEDIDDEEILDDEDDDLNTSSDDQQAQSQHRTTPRRRRTATVPARTSPASILSNLLGGRGVATSSRRSTTESAPVTLTTRSSMSSMAPVTAATTSLIDRYVTSPTNSDNTNALIEKKRELILLSKKYVLLRHFYFIRHSL